MGDARRERLALVDTGQEEAVSAARDEIELFLEEGTMRPYIRTALRALLTELDDESRLRRQAEGRLLTLHPRAEVERLRASNDRLIEIAKTVETESEESTKAAWDEVERLRAESNDQFMRQQQVIGRVCVERDEAIRLLISVGDRLAEDEEPIDAVLADWAEAKRAALSKGGK